MQIQKLSMSQIKIILTIILSCLFLCCSSKKNVIYLQNSDSEIDYITNYKTYILKTDDVLKIDVKAESPETTLQFNSGSIIQNTTKTKENMIFDGYIVNSNGKINFPNLGEIKVAGLTLDELRVYIYKAIVTKGILVSPTVDVKLLNGSFTILGEVNQPGKYSFLKNNLNVLEAIGIAGDLTINGKRNDIKIIRNQLMERIELFLLILHLRILC